MFRQNLREVRPGDELTPARWKELVDAVKAVPLQRGQNVRLRRTPRGTVISLDVPPARFAHPFEVRLLGPGAATISRGLVNGEEPKIGKVPISGTEKKAAPTLKFPEPLLDPDGRGYVAIEMTFTEEWKVAASVVVQCATLDSLNGKAPKNGGLDAGGVPILAGRKARHPLAMIRRRADEAIDIFQIEFFNLQVRVSTKNPDRPRAFFWPA